MRTLGSFACSATQSVLTSTSGSMYSAICSPSFASDPAFNRQTNFFLHTFHGELCDNRLEEPLDDHPLCLLPRQPTTHQIKDLLVVHHTGGRAVLTAHVDCLKLQNRQCIGARFITEQQAMC